MNRFRVIATAALLTATVSGASAGQKSPGRAVLEKMNATYSGKWYRTLTFVQKTTIFRPGAPERIQTWHESLRYTPEDGVQLRIDTDLAGGNGQIATADSMWIVRAGNLAQVRPSGNEFLPWIEGVYVQPLDLTEKQVRAMGVDLQKTRKATWRGRPVTIVGASDASDTTHSQAWIDDERQVIVRMIVKASDSDPLLDVMLDDYVRAGGGWLETKVDILIDGVLRQREEYSEFKTDIALPESLFDPAQWATAPHWAKKP